MDIITFQCPNCLKVLRIGADSAGKRARCSQCQQPLVIPAQSQPLDVPEAPRRSLLDDEGEENVYRFAAEPAPARPSRDKKERKVEQADLYKEKEADGAVDEEEQEREKERDRLLGARKREEMFRLRKVTIDFRQWEKVRLGIQFVFVGAAFWLAAVALQKLVFLLGLPHGDEYASAAATELIDQAQPIVPGVLPTLYRTRFIIGLIGGAELVDLNLWLYRISYLFTLIQLVCTGTGYALCLGAPRRYGARGLIVALLPVVAFSFVLTLGLKLLPMAGLYQYTMIPLIAPEVAILRCNTDRLVPIHLYWSTAPFAESLLSILLHLATFGELVLFCIFLRAVALNFKDESMQQRFDPLVQLGLGIGFILMAFHLMINTGTSEVLVNILWGVYLLAVGFYLWFLIWYLRALQFARVRLGKLLRIHGSDLAVDDEDDDDEDDDDEDDED